MMMLHVPVLDNVGNQGFDTGWRVGPLENIVLGVILKCVKPHSGRVDPGE